MATSAEHLILRGLQLIIRASFSPNEPVAQAKHFVALQGEIGPWLSDYAEEIAKPAIDLVPSVRISGGNQGGPVDTGKH